MFNTQHFYQTVALLISLSVLLTGLYSCKLKNAQNSTTADKSAPKAEETKVLVYGTGSDGLSLQWMRATDDNTHYDEIVYSIYLSNDGTLDSLENVTHYGTLIFKGNAQESLGTQLGEVEVTQLSTSSNSFSKETAGPQGEEHYLTFNVKDLSSGENYFFNVVAEDNAGNQNLYTMVDQQMGSDFIITFTPPEGIYDQDQIVSISVIPPEGTILYYSTDPTKEKSMFKQYSSDLSIQGENTEIEIRVFARNSQYADSGINSSTYKIDYTKVATPQFSVTPGTYNTAQEVYISTATDGAVIYYTTDGSLPSDQSTPYSGPILIADNPQPNLVTLRTIAIKTGKNNSDIQWGEYKVIFDQVAPPTFSPPVGGDIVMEVTEPILSFSSNTPGAAIYYTLDGSPPTESSIKFTGDISMDTQNHWDIRAGAFKVGMSPSVTINKEYYVYPSPPQFDFQSSPPCTITSNVKCYNTPVDLSMDTITPGTVIYYNLNSAQPTVNSNQFSSPIQLFQRETTVTARTWHPQLGFSNSSEQLWVNIYVSDLVITPDSTGDSLVPYFVKPTLNEVTCPLSIKLDSSTDNVNYQQRIWRVNGGWNGATSVTDITSDTFEFTHDNTTDVLTYIFFGKKIGRFPTAPRYNFKCTSI